MSNESKSIIEYDEINFPTAAGEIRKRLGQVPNFPFDKLERQCLLVLEIKDNKRVLEIIHIID